MRHMNRILPWGILAVVAIALAACNGNSTPAAPGPCGTPPGVSQTVMVYPAPGATGVPDGITQVVVGSTSSIPSGWAVTLIAPATDAGVQGNPFTAAPSPLPTPNQAPSFANPIYQTSTFSPLDIAGSSIAVLLNNTTSNCIESQQIGSFTTQ